MIIRAILALLVLALLPLAQSAARAAEGDLVISTFPMRGQLSRSAGQIMAEAYRRIGHTMELQFAPLERSLIIADGGKVDGELYRMEGLEKLYPNLRRVPAPLVRADFMVFARKGLPLRVDGWESLRPYVVGYVIGVKAIERGMPAGFNTNAVPDEEQLFLILDRGRVDVVISEINVGQEIVSRLGFHNNTMLQPPLMSIYLYHYVHVRNERLIPQLTTALQHMRAEGFPGMPPPEGRNSRALPASR